MLLAEQSGDVDLKGFAIGYGSHVVSDFVGFYVDPKTPNLHGYVVQYKYRSTVPLINLSSSLLKSLLIHSFNLLL